VTLRFSGL